MTIGNLKLYDIFRKDLHLSDDRALEVVNALDDHYEKRSSAKMEQLATKAELVAVKTELKEEQMAIKAELVAVKNELKGEIYTLSARVDLMATKQELSAVQTELKETIHSSETRINARSSYLTVVQLIAIVASLITIMRFMK